MSNSEKLFEEMDKLHQIIQVGWFNGKIEKW